MNSSSVLILTTFFWHVMRPHGPGLWLAGVPLYFKDCPLPFYVFEIPLKLHESHSSDWSISPFVLLISPFSPISHPLSLFFSLLRVGDTKMIDEFRPSKISHRPLSPLLHFSPLCFTHFSNISYPSGIANELYPLRLHNSPQAATFHFTKFALATYFLQPCEVIYQTNSVVFRPLS